MKKLLIKLIKELGKFFLSFFYTSSMKPQPAYFWATVFNAIAAWALYKHISNAKEISIQLILGILVYVGGWIALYYKTKKP